MIVISRGKKEKIQQLQRQKGQAFTLSVLITGIK